MPVGGCASYGRPLFRRAYAASNEYARLDDLRRGLRGIARVPGRPELRERGIQCVRSLDVDGHRGEQTDHRGTERPHAVSLPCAHHLAPGSSLWADRSSSSQARNSVQVTVRSSWSTRDRSTQLLEPLVDTDQPQLHLSGRRSRRSMRSRISARSCSMRNMMAFGGRCSNEGAASRCVRIAGILAVWRLPVIRICASSGLRVSQRCQREVHDEGDGEPHEPGVVVERSHERNQESAPGGGAARERRDRAGQVPSAACIDMRRPADRGLRGRAIDAAAIQ